jgi:dihydrofolate reductase
MIVALGRNRVIGIDNVMPWHIPDDLRYFRARTMGKPVVMGRRTLESIGGPLPGRFNIVVTRDECWRHPGVTVAATLEGALAAARAEAERIAADEAMIVGGGQIYSQLIDRADRLYLTEIDLAPDGHAFFPDYVAFGSWRETSREHHPAADGQPAFAFVVKDRC